MWILKSKPGFKYKGYYTTINGIGRCFILTRKKRTGSWDVEIYESPEKAKKAGWVKTL